MVAIFSALAFGLGHLPAVMLLLDIQVITALPPLLSEILLLNNCSLDRQAKNWPDVQRMNPSTVGLPAYPFVVE